jgi:hypothetical protein
VVQEVDDRDIRNAYDFYQALNNATGREMDTTVFRQNEEIDLQLQTK